MPKPAELEAQLAQQLRSVQAQAAALVGAVNKGVYRSHSYYRPWQYRTMCSVDAFALAISASRWTGQHSKSCSIANAWLQEVLDPPQTNSLSSSG